MPLHRTVGPSVCPFFLLTHSKVLSSQRPMGQADPGLTLDFDLLNCELAKVFAFENGLITALAYSVAQLE